MSFRSVLAQPEQAIDDLKITTAAEKTVLLDTFNATDYPYPQEQSVIDLFQKQVNQSPHQTALIFSDQKMSYGQLDELSDRLAAYLQQRGVAKGDKVGICLDRSFELIIGILGILKTGAVYVPIDPQYPLERIDYMMQDAQTNCIISQSNYENSFAQLACPLYLMDRLNWSATEAMEAPCPARADDPVYMMYTSGSTGQPKGLVIQHRAIARLIFNPDLDFLHDSATLYLYAPVTFDASTFEIWGALLTGGQLVISEPGLISLEDMASSLKQNKVNVLWLTAGLFHLAIDSHIALFDGLDYMLSGGDSINLHSVDKLLQHYPNLTFINGYGPTESTTFALTRRIKSDQVLQKGINNIGRPIGNTRAYILDWGSDTLLPIGCPGELCLSGPGLAMGYHKKPALSAEKFVDNPYGAGAHSRLYRTGDMARWLGDGRVEFLGRKDHQVKIRGFRIELGEIEHAINSSSMVQQSVVVVHKDHQGQKQLLAYVLPDAAYEQSALQNYLSDQLPKYQLPSIIMELDSFPLNANGKVDRKQLPEPTGPALTQKQYLAPRNEVERVLAAIWGELLGLETVGIRDNFFELGGHSLLATRVVAYIKQRLDVKLAIRDLFAHPSIEALSALIADKEEDLTQIAIVPRDPMLEKIPLSYAQERLWFLDQLNGSIHYHMPYVQFCGEQLEVPALSYALNSILNRHEALRSVIYKDKGKAYQRLLPKDTWQLEIAEASARELEEEVARAINQPFDLAKDHLLRAKLLRLERGYLLVLVIHHIASDAWSLDVLLSELQHFYTAKKENRAAELSPLFIQYPDYALWQRQYLSGEVLDQQLQYWEQQLAGLSPLNLPTDFVRPPIQSTKGSTWRFEIDGISTSLLKQICQSESVTLFMLLLSGFKVLLHRYSGQSDICVGSPVANRLQPELDPLIGFFVNTLALRSDVQGDLSFRQLLAQVKETTLAAYQYQDTPFEQVVDRLVKERDPSRTPLFQVLFTLQNASQKVNNELSQGLLGEGMDQGNYEAKHEVAKFDLTLAAIEADGLLRFNVEYCTDLFTEDSIRRMSQHYCELLSSICQYPDQPIAELNMLPEAERPRLASLSESALAAYPKQETLVSLLETQVRAHADRIALVYEGQKLDYRSLEEKANQLAHYLIQKGVPTKSLVGVCLERSPQMIISLLAVLKCGAAYVPIDPDYPQDRINYVIADAQLTCLITERAVSERVAADVPSILLDEEEALIAQQSAEAPQIAVQPNDLAYIIYTSGTTGKPKGVMIEHRNVVRLFYNEHNLFDFGPADVWTLFHSFCFDFSVWEIYGALLFGGQLIILPKAITKDPSQYCSLLHDAGVTVLNQTPNAFYSLQEFYTERYSTSSIRYVIFGGEALSPNKLQGWKQAYPHTRMINMYGITETTVHVTYKEIQEEDMTRGISNIGKAIPTLQCYILDEAMQLLPPGISGEIYVSGPGLARGYLHRPELTAERFVDNPFASDEHGKLYKTGDLARWLPNGEMEYLGRKDNQVKIRGYRIELGEVEHALNTCESVKQAIVLVKKDVGGVNNLVAYVVSEGAMNKEQIQADLREKLPEYMRPQLLVEIAQLPLTVNGKVDKKQLPDPFAHVQHDRIFLAPQNKAEQLIRSIWSEVLGIPADRISTDDNFFELGGNSISSIKLISRLQANFLITINDLFSNPSIRELAVVAEYEDNYLKNKLESYLIKLRAKDLIEQVAGKELERVERENREKIEQQKQPYLKDLKQLWQLDLKERRSYDHIVLSGATGFLGIHILQELLKNTASNITLLVRGDNDQHAAERLHQKYQFYFEEDLSAFGDRIRIYRGDLERAYFGLEKSIYLELADHVDAFINSAANVKHYGQLDAFIKVNAASVDRILEFCELSRPKVLHQISTPSVSGMLPEEDEEVVEEQEVDLLFRESDIDKGQLNTNFYSQSKLAAEVRIDQARQRGVDANIYRVGNLSYHSETGKFQENITNNAFYNQIRMYLKLGYLPQDMGDFEVSNIDLTAAAFVRLFDKEALLNRNFHLFNPHSVDVKTFTQYLNNKSLLAMLAKRFSSRKSKSGADLKCVSLTQFFEQLLAQYDELEDQINRLFLQFNVFDEQDIEKKYYHICTEETNYLLDKVGFKWPKITRKSVQRMLQYGKKIQFFE
ncbi:MAG: amino acid adenylation domain-containing protein [Bacteroidota bacterium]